MTACLASLCSVTIAGVCSVILKVLAHSGRLQQMVEHSGNNKASAFS